MAGDIVLSSNFELVSGRPLDGRLNKDSIAERNSIPQIQRYDRMIVAVNGGLTYQLQAGSVDEDLSNNDNWVEFGGNGHKHKKIQDSDVVLPTYVFGAGTSSMESFNAKEITLHFIGSGKYVNEIILNSGASFDKIEIYENGIEIINEDFNPVLINSRYTHTLINAFKAETNSNYSIRIYKQDGSSVGVSVYNSGSYTENSVSYSPVSFTLDYIDDADNEYFGLAKTPIYFLRGAAFSVVQTDKSAVSITGETLDIDAITTIKKDLVVQGNIIQQGAAYNTHAEEFYSSKDMVIMRDGALAGLAANELSGFRILKYDGVNNLVLAVGSDGIGRIGDESGNLQAIATREDNPTDQGFGYWDEASLKFKTKLLLASDISDFAEAIASNTPWVVDGSNISYSGGNVCVGGSNLSSLFSVKGGTSGVSDLFSLFDNSDNEILKAYHDTNAGVLDLLEGATTKIRITGKSGVSSYFNAGNFGLGNPAPAYIFDIKNNDYDYFLHKSRSDGSQSMGLRGLASGTLAIAVNNIDALSIDNSGVARFSEFVSAKRYESNAVAGTNRGMLFRTAGVARWASYVDSTAEAGSNAGSNYRLYRYSDTGTYLGIAFEIIRSSGAIKCENTVTAKRFFTGYDFTIKTDGFNCGVDGINGGISFYNGSNASSASIFREDVANGNFYVGVRGGVINNGIVIASTGKVGILKTPSLATLDVNGTAAISGNVTMGKLLIQPSSGTPEALISRGSNDNTVHYGVFGTKHYKAAEQPFSALYLASNSSGNVLNIGGGSSSHNASTAIQFWIAANGTTTTGSIVLQIDSNGRFIFQQALPTSSTGLAGGTLYTQTAAQLGGSGTQKVVCIV